KKNGGGATCVLFVNVHAELEFSKLPLTTDGAESGIGDPRLAPSTTNCTVPVGVPDAALTVAVNVTASPEPDGFSDELTVVVVAMGAGAATSSYAPMSQCAPCGLAMPR